MPQALGSFAEDQSEERPTHLETSREGHSLALVS